MIQLPPLFALVGPTASGKTALALQLAQRFSFEIISVDSALVYRDMDIGTAKPTKEELALVSHHLIDVCSPLEAYSAAQFVSDTLNSIRDIESRGRRPLLVGGTFLYFNALLNGLSKLPAADADYRAKLDVEAEEVGWPALHERLAAIDPVTALRLHSTDRQRIQRALEVHYLTGRPLSESFNERSPLLEYRPVLMGLNMDRRQLHERIAQRFHGMVEAGLLAEVQMLRECYPGLHAHLPSMRCVGYRQAWEHLIGTLSATEWIERGMIATRQLAKRQVTWMRHFPGVPIYHVEATPSQALDQLTDFVADGLRAYV